MAPISCEYRYGTGAVGVGDDCAAFSRSFAALAVACCKRSESDLSRAASGVDCGFTLVSGLSEREHPAVKMPAARSKSKNLFINGNERRDWGECNCASVRA